MGESDSDDDQVDRPATLRWVGGTDGYLRLLDQTQLPDRIVFVDCPDEATVWQAIRQLQVRGAPAIGIAAAYGVVLGVQRASDEFVARARQVIDHLATSRPTAVNLFWALERMQRRMDSIPEDLAHEERVARLLAEARSIHDEDRRICHQIGRHGQALCIDGMNLLTHCNAGGLATSEYGTALSVVFTAHDLGKRIHVFVDETRPLLQGARLTTWELAQHGVAHTLIGDSAAAHMMKMGRVDAVITGADRIAANGDAANKIGTYALAVAAAAHAIPFYIAAPRSTFDLSLATGDQIPIEERSEEEVTHCRGQRIAPPGTHAANPAFDVTPAQYITAIVTERGLIRPVTSDRIQSMFGDAQSRPAGTS